jgi:HSP20 family protein
MEDKTVPSQKNTLLEEIRDLFSRFSDEWPDLAPLNKNGYVPHIDVLDKAGSYVVLAEIPGMNEKEIIVTLDKNTLIIEGDKKSESADKEENYFKSEIAYGRFYRTIDLKEDVDKDDVKATYRNGVLRISLKKNEQSRTNKRVAINVVKYSH